MKVFTVIAGVLACALAGAALTVGLSIQGGMNGQLRALKGENASLQGQLDTASAKESADYATVHAQMGHLAAPTDPLSAYDQICNSQFTNGSTGTNQTYYYPCTNNVQTIPQPGG